MTTTKFEPDDLLSESAATTRQQSLADTSFEATMTSLIDSIRDRLASRARVASAGPASATRVRAPLPSAKDDLTSFSALDLLPRIEERTNPPSSPPVSELFLKYLAQSQRCLEDIESSSDTAPTDLLEITHGIDAALIGAAEAVETTDLSDSDKAAAFVERANSLIESHGVPMLRRTIRFLADDERSAYGPSALVGLSESQLAATYDDPLIETLIQYLGPDHRNIRYAVVAALGRRRGEKAVSVLSRRLQDIADDPVLSEIAGDYLQARGVNVSKTAQKA